MPKNFLLIKNLKALGTLWNIEIFEYIESNKKNQIKKHLIETILDFEKKYSRFDSQSLLSNLNQIGVCDFDHYLFDMICQGEDWRNKTDGFFDLFIKENLEKAGYGEKSTTSRNKKKYTNEDDRILKKENFIFLNTSKQIDLGGIGKGYLIDLIAKDLKNFGIKYFLINGGGDIFVTSDNGKEIEILLENPESHGLYIGKILLKNKSLCASSSYKRVWETNGESKNHFIDTKNNGFVYGASFVVTGNTTKSDVLASICVLMSKNQEELIKLLNKEKAEYLFYSQDRVFMSDIFKKAIKNI